MEASAAPVPQLHYCQGIGKGKKSQWGRKQWEEMCMYTHSIVRDPPPSWPPGLPLWLPRIISTPPQPLAAQPNPLLFKNLPKLSPMTRNMGNLTQRVAIERERKGWVYVSQWKKAQGAAEVGLHIHLVLHNLNLTPHCISESSQKLLQLFKLHNLHSW